MNMRPGPAHPRQDRRSLLMSCSCLPLCGIMWDGLPTFKCIFVPALSPGLQLVVLSALLDCLTVKHLLNAFVNAGRDYQLQNAQKDPDGEELQAFQY